MKALQEKELAFVSGGEGGIYDSYTPPAGWTYTMVGQGDSQAYAWTPPGGFVNYITVGEGDCQTQAYY
jgi:hypothetical protein